VIVPVCLVVCLCTDSFNKFMLNPATQMWDFWVMLAVFCLSANLLVVSQLMCTVNTSALTTSITSSITSIVATVGSLFLMGLTLTPMFVTGVSVAMFGVALYTICKVMQVRNKGKEEMKEEMVDKQGIEVKEQE